jgi:hypothetical protein
VARKSRIRLPVERIKSSPVSEDELIAALALRHLLDTGMYEVTEEQDRGLTYLSVVGAPGVFAPTKRPRCLEGRPIALTGRFAAKLPDPFMVYSGQLYPPVEELHIEWLSNGQGKGRNTRRARILGPTNFSDRELPRWSVW